MAPGVPHRAGGWIGRAGLRAGVIEAAPPAPATLPIRSTRRRRTALRPSGGIELEIDGVVVRVGSGTNAKTIAAVIQALKGGS